MPRSMAGVQAEHLDRLQAAFTQLGLGGTASTGTELTNPPFLYLAITSEDASIVYYKLSNGIAKPLV